MSEDERARVRAQVGGTPVYAASTRLVFLAAAMLIILTTLFVYRVGLIRLHAQQKMVSQLLVLQHLDELISSVKDTETGQRGYLLTGDEQYLQPYTSMRVTVQRKVDDLRRLVESGDLPKDGVDKVAALTEQKLAELDQTVQLRRGQGLEAALNIVRASYGRHVMDDLRAEINRMRGDEAQEFAAANLHAYRAADLLTAAFVGGCVLNLAFLWWAFRKISGEAGRREAARREIDRQRERAQDALRDSAERSARDLRAMTRLHDVGIRCARAGNEFHACLNAILDAAIALTGAEKGNIQLLDESGALRIAAQQGFKDSFLDSFDRAGSHTWSACGLAATAIERVIIEDVARSDMLGQAELDVLLAADVRAVQSTPLVSSDGTALGMISTHFGQPHRPAEHQLRLMDLLARQAADYLERRRNEEELRQSESRLSNELDRMSRLHGISGRMALSGDIRSLLEQILAASADFTGTDKGDIQFLDPDTGHLRIVVHQGLGARFVEHFADHGWVVAGHAALHKGERVIVEDVANHAASQGTVELEIVLEDGIRAIQSTPLVTRDGRLVGMLNNHFRAVHRPSELDLRYVDLLARMAADLIERTRAEEALRRAQLTLQQHAATLEATVERRTARLNEIIGDLEGFSYSIVHDMRSPLRAMQSFAQLLAEECEPISPVAEDYVRRIKTAAERMDHLIQDGLNYSYVMRGELPLAPIDAGALLQGMVETYPGFQPPQAEIELEGPVPLVLGNEGALTQCLSNLLGNAVRFVAPGVTPHVRVWAEPRDGRVRLYFEDNGIGIDKEFHEQVFQVFHRLDNRYGGTGIGLAIVKKAAERMGGSVGLTSEPGKGSTFWVEFAAAGNAQGLALSAGSPSQGDRLP